MLRSRNYAPSAALAHVIARHYVFSVDAPATFELIDKLLSETAFLRVLIKGDWAAETGPGTWTNVGPMVFFGANSKPMTVRVRGGFVVIGVAFRPGGWRCLFDRPANEFTDLMLPMAQLWGENSAALHADLIRLAHDDDDAIVATIEQHVAAMVENRSNIAADSAMTQFELIARNDSTILTHDAAAKVGLSLRQLERHCRSSFGMSPKTVLRRSRFLDMASAIRGLSRPDEGELAALRYYDQSHLNREFRRFIGMTPGQFAQLPTPLLTAGLELRILRKAEDASAAAATVANSR